MAQNDTKFSEYLSGEVRKYQGTCVPLLSGILRRILVRRLPYRKLHPNPEDEFCNPEIGPNYEIISGYRGDASRRLQHRLPVFGEPIIIERMNPDGYIILNGHHRWAAAVMMDLQNPLCVRIINATRMADIKRMLSNSENDKRATLDLDEVVLRKDENEPAEKAVPFPLSLRYSQRLRLGIPGLFSYLDAHGYDIWVYSEKYYSLKYIRMLFRLKHVHVTGIVTGSVRGQEKKKIEKEIRSHYHTTVSIDRDMILRINHRTKAFDEYPLTGAGGDWSAAAIGIIGGFAQDEASGT